MNVWIELIVAFSISRFIFYFFLYVNSNLTWIHYLYTIHALFIIIHALFMY